MHFRSAPLASLSAFRCPTSKVGDESPSNREHINQGYYTAFHRNRGHSVASFREGRDRAGPALPPRSCVKIKRSPIAGTIAAAKGMALAPNELSITAPPINPPSAFAILKAEMFAVAASSGAALPYFMTRICIGGTLAKDATPKTNAAARNGHLNGATKPVTIRDAIIAAGQRMSERRRFASAVRPPSVLPTRRPKPTITRTQVRSAALKPATRATGAK